MFSVVVTFFLHKYEVINTIENQEIVEQKFGTIPPTPFFPGGTAVVLYHQQSKEKHPIRCSCFARNNSACRGILMVSWAIPTGVGRYHVPVTYDISGQFDSNIETSSACCQHRRVDKFGALSLLLRPPGHTRNPTATPPACGTLAYIPRTNTPYARRTCTLPCRDGGAPTTPRTNTARASLV